MNEQLMQALSQLLSTISAGITEGVSFAQEQLPDVIMQLLWWEGVKSFTYFFVTLLVAFALYWVGFVNTKAHSDERKAQSKARIAEWIASKPNHYMRPTEYDPWNDPACVVPIVVCSTCLILCALVLMSSLDWLKILIAPKVWLIEYAATLVK